MPACLLPMAGVLGAAPFGWIGGGILRRPGGKLLRFFAALVYFALAPATTFVVADGGIALASVAGTVIGLLGAQGFHLFLVVAHGHPHLHPNPFKP